MASMVQSASHPNLQQHAPGSPIHPDASPRTGLPPSQLHLLQQQQVGLVLDRESCKILGSESRMKSLNPTPFTAVRLRMRWEHRACPALLADQDPDDVRVCGICVATGEPSKWISPQMDWQPLLMV